MQVSSAMRVEARKLFWSCPDAWYWVDGHWLLAGGFPGHAHHAIDFLAHIEQVEVDFNNIKTLREDWEAEICRNHVGEPVAPSQGVEDRIRDFWQTLQHRLPRATNVVVSESRPRRAGESPPHDFKVMVEMCHAGISASASFFKMAAGNTHRLERSLWRRARGDASTAGGWEKISPTWTRQSILLPPKEFRGPVGAYERVLYKSRRYCLQKWAEQRLLIEAIERHHFHERHEPFDCFHPECNAQFGLPGEWTLHAIDSGHSPSAVPPDEVKASFDQHKNMLEQMQKQDVAWGRVKEDRGEDGSKRRHNAEQAFLHQLDHDPLYAHGKPARECSTWVMYTRNMTYIY